MAKKVGLTQTSAGPGMLEKTNVQLLMDRIGSIDKGHDSSYERGRRDGLMEALALINPASIKDVMGSKVPVTAPPPTPWATESRPPKLREPMTHDDKMHNRMLDPVVQREWLDYIITESEYSLGTWEEEFIDSLDNQLRAGKVLSEKQAAALKRIYDKAS